MRDERLGEGAAVARLQDRRLDLDEAVARRGIAGSPSTDRACAGAHPRATPRSRAGRGSAAGSGSRRPDAVEGVRQRLAVLREQLERLHGQRRLAASSCAPGRPRRRPCRRGRGRPARLLPADEQLDAARSGRRDRGRRASPCRAGPSRGRRAGGSRRAPRPARAASASRADGRDLDAVGKPFRQRHRAAILRGARLGTRRP